MTKTTKIWKANNMHQTKIVRNKHQDSKSQLTKKGLFLTSGSNTDCLVVFLVPNNSLSVRLSLTGPERQHQKSKRTQYMTMNNLFTYVWFCLKSGVWIHPPEPFPYLAWFFLGYIQMVTLGLFSVKVESKTKSPKSSLQPPL